MWADVNRNRGSDADSEVDRIVSLFAPLETYSYLLAFRVFGVFCVFVRTRVTWVFEVFGSTWNRFLWRRSFFDVLSFSVLLSAPAQWLAGGRACLRLRFRGCSSPPCVSSSTPHTPRISIYLSMSLSRLLTLSSCSPLGSRGASSSSFANEDAPDYPISLSRRSLPLLPSLARFPAVDQNPLQGNDSGYYDSPSKQAGPYCYRRNELAREEQACRPPACQSTHQSVDHSSVYQSDLFD